jgi:uncharacterized protein DUF4234
LFSDTELRHRSILAMIGLSILTLGLYYPVWFLRRREALNHLPSPRKLELWPFSLVFAYQTVSLCMALFWNWPKPDDESTSQLAWQLLRLALGVLMLIQTFFVKDILEDALSPPRQDVFAPLTAVPVRLSGVMTFVFGIFYLQYHINELRAHRDVVLE